MQRASNILRNAGYFICSLSVMMSATEKENDPLPNAYDRLLDRNIRSGSLVAYWCLKSRLIRLCAIAFHKWVRHTDSHRLQHAAATNRTDVMSEEMENIRNSAVGSRQRRKGQSVKCDMPATELSEYSNARRDEATAVNTGTVLKKVSQAHQEKTVDAFADAVHDAIVDGKRNLLCKSSPPLLSLTIMLL